MQTTGDLLKRISQNWIDLSREREREQEQHLKRLQTYTNWKYVSTSVTPDTLAKNGLRYTGTDDKVDRVQCVSCYIELFNWQEYDIVEFEHFKHSPDCYLAKKHFVDKTSKVKSCVSCPVCLTSDTNQTIALYCGHTVCGSCITDSRLYRKCPLCRRDINYISIVPLYDSVV
jgi:hypothetical protein